MTVARIMANNGCLRHVYTKPNTPRTYGKAERFIQTALREWAYAKAYDTFQTASRRPAPQWSENPAIQLPVEVKISRFT
jgi:hypothetical protein